MKLNVSSQSKSARALSARSWTRNTLINFSKSKRGNIAILTALTLPVLVGFAGLGSESVLWFYTHHQMQDAADSAAISAATAYSVNSSTNITTQADGVASSYGYTDGSNRTTVTVNRPPSSGNYTSNTGAVEVIVTQTQTRYLSAVWSSSPLNISARAVAKVANGVGCVLALNPTAAASASEQGSVSIALNGCSLYDNSNASNAVSLGGSAFMSALSVSTVGNVYGSGNITTTYGIETGTSPTTDPYAGVNPPTAPSTCDQTNYSTHGTVTLNPGVYCGGMSLGAGAAVTLNPGTYYITNNGNSAGSLTMNGQAALSGSGVTLVFTGSGTNYSTASISGGATVNLTAPTSGTMAGIVMFGDRNTPTGTLYKFTGGTNQSFGGAVYLPKGQIWYAGGATGANGCNQVIGDTIQFVGNTNLAVNCSGYGTQAVGTLTAKLVE